MTSALTFVITITITSVLIPQYEAKCYQLENCSCPNLTTVTCENANMTDVPNNLSPNTNVLWLDFSNNSISILKNSTFRWHNNSAMSIYHLALHHNRISVIEVGALKPLSNLTYLNLASNNLSSLPTDVFQNNSNLTVLYLNKNLYLQLPPSGYNLPKVKILHLQHCRLNEISVNFFETMRSIKDLNIANNHISHLDPEVFSPLKHLEVLSLQRNRLTSLTSLLNIPPSTVVELWGNPWQCGCQLATDFHRFSKATSRPSLHCGFTFSDTFKIDSTSYLSICKLDDTHRSGSYHTETLMITVSVLIVLATGIIVLIKPLRRCCARRISALHNCITNIKNSRKQGDTDCTDLLDNAPDLDEEMSKVSST